MSALKTNGARTDVVRETGPALTYTTAPPSSEKGAGWVLFAGIMFAISACLNIIWGIAAVSNSHFFVANAHYIISSLHTWGWIAIGFGAVEGLAVLSIWRGGQLGRWFGIVVAGFAALVAMLSIPAYPLWSLILVALDILVIYGLAAYGGKPELAR
jgi:hypothetical protein